MMAKVGFDGTAKWIRKSMFRLTHEEVDGKVQKRALKWRNIIGLFVIHSIALYAVLFGYKHCRSILLTTIFNLAYGFPAGMGITAGVHRLWTHRSYKAKTPLRILLAIFFAAAGQNTIPQWVLDHKVHHKFTETHADPHNAARGFFFSHVGWLMQEKSDSVKLNGKKMDMSDVLEDPVVKYHTKFFIPLKLIFTFLLPIWFCVHFFDETWSGSTLVCFARMVLVLNITWAVNSAAHLYGNKPYDQRIGPVENKVVSFFAGGEGWHNYHHVFPWDYKAAEFGITPNITTSFINFMAAIGWAYDLKYPSTALINKVSEKYGDGSRHNFEVQQPQTNDEEPEVIDIGDYDMGEKQL